MSADQALTRAQERQACLGRLPAGRARAAAVRANRGRSQQVARGRHARPVAGLPRQRGGDGDAAQHGQRREHATDVLAMVQQVYTEAGFCLSTIRADPKSKTT